MKVILLSLFVFSFLLLAAEPKVVSFDKLQHRGRLTYIPNQDTPFTGIAVRFYPDGQRVWEENYKDGKLDGLQTIWYEGGQKKAEGINKDGYPHGLWTQWYPDGQKKSESICKDGKVMSAKVWKPNGEKCPVTSLKDGNGLLALWHVNGQKSSEAKFKNGKREGRMIYYNYDGTEMGSIKYMDGERIYDFD